MNDPLNPATLPMLLFPTSSNALKEALSEKTAAFMITNPSTLGVFESNILEIAKEMKIDMQGTQDMDQALTLLLEEGEIFESSRRKLQDCLKLHQ